MQMLWQDVFEGNRPITAHEFLYCYKPSKIKQSAGFYQFSSRGPQFSLIRGRSSSNRLWKKEFFFISGNWAKDPIDVNNAPSLLLPVPQVVFVLRVCLSSFPFVYFIQFFPHLILSYIGVAITRPHLDKFHLERIDKAHAYAERSFHSLVTLCCLAVQGLGPKPTKENLAHEKTTCRSKCCPLHFIISFFFIHY